MVEIPLLGHNRDEAKSAAEPVPRPSPIQILSPQQHSITERSKEDEKVSKPLEASQEIRKSSEVGASEIQASSIFKSVYEPSKEPIKEHGSSIKESLRGSPIDDIEEKYNKLFTEYNVLQKERNELRTKIEELETRNELGRKKENAMRQIAPRLEGFQLVHLIIVAIVSLLLGAFLTRSH